jgi:hypothetical protein
LVARRLVELAEVYSGDEDSFCATLDRCKDVSLYLLDHASRWLGDD